MYPLPRLQNRHDRPSATLHLAVLVRHLPKASLPPRTLGTEARARKGQDSLVLFWIWGLKGPHPQKGICLSCLCVAGELILAS